MHGYAAFLSSCLMGGQPKGSVPPQSRETTISFLPSFPSSHIHRNGRNSLHRCRRALLSFTTTTTTHLGYNGEEEEEGSISQKGSLLQSCCRRLGLEMCTRSGTSFLPPSGLLLFLSSSRFLPPSSIQSTKVFPPLASSSYSLASRPSSPLFLSFQKRLLLQQRLRSPFFCLS